MQNELKSNPLEDRDNEDSSDSDKTQKIEYNTSLSEEYDSDHTYCIPRSRLSSNENRIGDSETDEAEHCMEVQHSDDNENNKETEDIICEVNKSALSNSQHIEESDSQKTENYSESLEVLRDQTLEADDKAIERNGNIEETDKNNCETNKVVVSDKQSKDSDNNKTESDIDIPKDQASESNYIKLNKNGDTENNIEAINKESDSEITESYSESLETLRDEISKSENKAIQNKGLDDHEETEQKNYEANKVFSDEVQNKEPDIDKIDVDMEMPKEITHTSTETRFNENRENESNNCDINKKELYNNKTEICLETSKERGNKEIENMEVDNNGEKTERNNSATTKETEDNPTKSSNETTEKDFATSKGSPFDRATDLEKDLSISPTESVDSPKQSLTSEDFQMSDSDVTDIENNVPYKSTIDASDRANIQENGSSQNQSGKDKQSSNLAETSILEEDLRLSPTQSSNSSCSLSGKMEVYNTQENGSSQSQSDKDKQSGNLAETSILEEDLYLSPTPSSSAACSHPRKIEVCKSFSSDHSDAMSFVFEVGDDIEQIGNCLEVLVLGGSLLL